MTNEERINELKLEKEKIDREIRQLTHSGRLCDYVSKIPIECIRLRGNVPQYAHERRGVWKHIADMSKCIFLENSGIHSDMFSPRACRKFKEFSVEEMEAAAALADELTEVFNRHFMKYNPTIKRCGLVERVIDNE